MKVLILVLAIFTSSFAVPATEYITSSNNTTFKLTATPNLRIINGQNAGVNQFPYQISFQQRSILGTFRHICGGSIIGRNYILTAAHCIAVNPVASNYRVVAGVTDLTQTSPAPTIVQISAIIVHELFPGGPTVAANDIALLRLATLLDWSASIQPIPVPNPGHISTGLATLSGWGATNAAGTAMPSYLQFADLPVVENLECNNRLNRILNSRQHPFDFESNLCSGSTTGFQSACGGDSGGPLAKNGRVIGVVSWGITPCGSVSDAPTVYARVANYVTWIQEKAPDLQQ